MKFYVTYKVEGRYVAEVDASSIEEARIKSTSNYIDADFGVLSDIEGEDIIIEDENGNFVWER